MTEYAFFTDAAARTFRAAAECIVPDDEGGEGAARDEVLAIADRALARRPQGDQKKLLLFLGALEKLPFVRYGRPFSKLSPERRARVLAWFENNTAMAKFRQGFFGLKTFILMGHYGAESTFSELDYPGPRKDAPYYEEGPP